MPTFIAVRFRVLGDFSVGRERRVVQLLAACDFIERDVCGLELSKL